MINMGKGTMARGFGGTSPIGPRGKSGEVKEPKEERQSAAFRANETYQAQRRARLEKELRRKGRL